MGSIQTMLVDMSSHYSKNLNPASMLPPDQHRQENVIHAKLMPAAYATLFRSHMLSDIGQESSTQCSGVVDTKQCAATETGRNLPYRPEPAGRAAAFSNCRTDRTSCLLSRTVWAARQGGLTCQHSVQVQGVQLLLLSLALSFSNRVSIAAAEATSAADVITPLDPTPTQDLADGAWCQTASAL